jgi:hypothetical protein
MNSGFPASGDNQHTSSRGALPGTGTRTPTRNLVLAYRPGWQSLSDLGEIKRHVADIEPTIEVFILPATLPNSVSRKQIAMRPTLVVSPGPLVGFDPPRGLVYQGRPVAKLQQLKRLVAVGVRVPRTAVLGPDTRLDPAVWGAFVVIKPADLATASYGAGIRLSRTERVRYRPPAEFPAGSPGRRAPMLVQQFIDSGEYVEVYRVLTLFGEPLYCQRMVSRQPRVALDADDATIESAIIASQALDEVETFVSPADVLGVARSAHAALPDVPLKGCDITRDAKSGLLYVLEVNPGGNTWHFSSAFLAEIRKANGPAFELERRQQFDAMRTAARVLVAKTLQEAR